MLEIVVAIAGILGPVLVALLGLWGARKYKIGPFQDKLVETLKDTVDAQETRIQQLETLVDSQTEKINYLNSEVARLTKLTISQLIRIQELELEDERDK